MKACGAEIAMQEAPDGVSVLRCSCPARKTLKVPCRSMSMTVLKAFADMPTAGTTKLPAAPEISTSMGPRDSTAVLRA